MRRFKRLLTAASVVMAGFLYVWVAAVRAVPGVKERKRARMDARSAAHR